MMSEGDAAGIKQHEEGRAGRRWGMWCWLLLLAVVLLLAGSEGYLRWGVGLGDPPLWMADDRVEYLLVPNQERWRWGNRIVVNDLGMRSDAFPRSRERAEAMRVVVIGDSVVNGGTLVDHDALATTLLADRLEAKLDRPVEVGNLSAGSWGPENMAAAFERLGFEQLDVVIVVVSSHDLTDVPKFEALDPHQYPTVSPWSATTEALGRYAPALWRWWNKQEGPWDELLPRVDMVAAERSQEALRRLFEDARRTGARVVLVVHPDVDEVRAGELHANGRVMLGEARANGVEAVDAIGVMLDAFNAEKQPYRDIIHPSDEGYVVYAGLFERLVVGEP